MRPLYEAADILLHNAVAEGHPYAILEAMQAGLPVVARRNPGVAELVLHNRTGGLFQASAEMTTIIASLRENTGRCHQMGQVAREYVRANHLLDRQVEALMTVYEEQCCHN
jgi:glycosyltransferase involved in cell wall biosynthesis